MSTEPHLSHLDASGEVNMVDVSAKTPTVRDALASASVLLPEACWQAIETGPKKGDLWATVRLAGIGGAKKTSDLIPLCHPLPLSKVHIDIEIEKPRVSIRCRAKCTGRTGVEMEALTGASVAALALYDMLKGVDKGIVIESIRLLSKSGGKSGHWSV